MWPRLRASAEARLQDLLGARREGELPGGDLLAGAHDPDNLNGDALDGDVETLKHARRESLLLAEQPEQNVLSADVVVLERPRLLLGEQLDLGGLVL